MSMARTCALTSQAHEPVSMLHPMRFHADVPMITAAVKGLKVGGWSSSFHEVLTDMLGRNAPRAVIINPIVGPEAIAGSSRMKGGSATKIICETMATVAVALALGSGAAHRAAVAADPFLLHATVRDAFMQYETAVRHVYAHAKGIHTVVDAAAAAATTVVPFEDQLSRCPGASASGAPEERLLVSPTGAGRIAYVGVGTAGILGLIDASECNPTYGALFNAVRGFVAGAWATVGNKQGPQSLPVPPHMRGDAHLHTASVPEFVGLGCEAFIADFAPTLTPDDTVIMIHVEEKAEDAGPAHLADALAAVQLAKSCGARVVHAIVASSVSLAVGAKGPGAAAVAAIRAAVPEGVVVPLPSLTLKLNLPLSLPPGAASAASHAAATGGGATGAAATAGGAGAGAGARHALSTSPASGAGSDAVLTYPQLLFDGSGLDTSGAPSFLGELAQKLLLNAITVTAHVRRGTIFRNRMVNVMMTNAKLFHRAVGIVADTAGCPREAATIAVLRAIYHRDDFFAPSGGYMPVGHLLPGAPVPAVKPANVTLAELRGAPLSVAAALPVSNHVHNASGQRGLVPVAILLALDELTRTRGGATAGGAGAGGVRLPMSEADAVALLTRQPVVRLALLEALAGGSRGGAGSSAPALRDGKA